MHRRIIAYHLDAEAHWVADLECGHGQHVRHDPPWQVRPWVITEQGRASHLGTVLNCRLCDEAAAPTVPAATSNTGGEAMTEQAEAETGTRRHVPSEGVDNWITHTDIASSDPGATKAWCERVMGWRFMEPFPMDGGEYHLFAYAEKGGGGIRGIGQGEAPHCVPDVHVPDAREAFRRAIGAGAVEVSAPTRVMDGVTIAVVRAPGGVLIGFSGP